jgi:hypothetical protein
MSVSGYVQSDAQYSQQVVSGNANAAGGLVLGSETRADAGAASISVPLTLVTTTGVRAVTLANGNKVGQLKQFIMTVSGGTATVTPVTTCGAYANFQLANVGDSVTVVWTGAPGWALLNRDGGTHVGNTNDNAVATLPVIA